MRPHVRQLYFEHAMLDLAVSLNDNLGLCQQADVTARNQAWINYLESFNPWLDGA